MNKKFKHLPISWIDATIFQHFEKVSKNHPEKIALNDGENILTYNDVLFHTNRIAKNIHDIRENNDPVIILLENNAFFICAMLACLAEGRGYIPLDSAFAYERNNQIINHCKSKVIISQTSLIKEFNLDSSFQLIELNTEVNECISQNYEYNPENLAYILYTSGSTGQPKGVFQNQKNLLHDVIQYINVAEITSEDRLSLLYSPSVNGAIRDIYGALLTGATLFINNLQKNGVASLPRFIKGNKLTIYHSIPSIFRTGLSHQTSQSFKTVRLIYLAGDKIFSQDIELYKQLFSDACKVYIGIGSTENATIYRQWFIGKKTKISSGIVPVGYPVEDRIMTLVDTDGNETKQEFAGEIYVRSKYCALGYWNDDALTQKHFIFHKDGSRTVKTGDWGIVNSDNLLEYKGRQDGQIKINGFRVEIGEIEAYIRSIVGVEDAAILVRNNEGVSKTVAYVLLKEDSSIEDIKVKLLAILPKHMFPSFFYVIEKIPYLSNFKIDYQTLKNIDQQNILKENLLKNNTEVSRIEPLLYTKERILSLWCKYASYESFINDRTWKLGGASSLEAVSFIFSIEKEFNIEFPNEWINEDIKPSILENQIKLLVEKKELFFKEETEDLVHVFAFPPLRGMISETREFLRVLNEKTPVTLIDYPKLEDWKKEDICLENISNSIDKSIFKKGKYKVFIGYCSGDQIAFYLLNQLEKDYPNTMCFFIMDNRILTNYNFSERFKRHLKTFGLLKTVKRSFKSIKTRTKNLISHQNNYDFAQVKVRFEKFPFKPMNIKAHLLISSSRNSLPDELGWAYFLPNITSELLNFNHSEMFRNKQNQKVVLEKLLNFIEELKTQ